MANMVAVVLACEPCSNHLWYHMFAANELSGSHMTGFMVSPIIITEELSYVGHSIEVVIFIFRDTCAIYCGNRILLYNFVLCVTINAV